jgi:hypothetical protein
VADRATIGDSIGGVGPGPSSHFPTMQSGGLSDQQLAGPEGYRRVENSDRKHVVPGAKTIRELFGGEPTLIMIDEVSVYLRKVERAHPGAGEEFTAILQALIKAVESSIRRYLAIWPGMTDSGTRTRKPRKWRPVRPGWSNSARSSRRVSHSGWSERSWCRETG